MKARTPRCKKYLAWIREQRCVGLCRGRESPTQVEAAHVRFGNGGGMGLKPSDFRAVPLCFECHGHQHQVGERTFWDSLGYSPDLVALRLLARWAVHVDRAKEALAALEATLIA